MIDFTTNLKQEVEQKIHQIESGEKDILLRVTAASDMLEGVFGQLKEFISNYTFADEQEEIRFFKEIKPGIFCHLLYYRKVYNIEMNRPMGSEQEQVRYLDYELELLHRYNSRRLDFYRYYRSGATHLDREYFLRGNRNYATQYLDCFYFERDPVFSTVGDFRVARILANDMLRRYIRDELEKIRLNQYLLNQTPEIRLDTPRWTAKKIGLIVLLHAVAAAGCVDNGEIPVSRLAACLEQTFDIKLGNVSRALNDIRFHSNPGAFLDELKEALLRKLEELEEKNMKENLIRNNEKKTEKK